MRIARWALCLSGSWAASAPAQVPLGVAPDLWQQALAWTLLVPSDLGFRNDYVEIDDARLAVVDSLMADPARLPAWLLQVMDSTLLFVPAGDPPAALPGQPPARGIWDWAGLGTQVPPAPARPDIGPRPPDLPRATDPILAALRAVNREPLAARSDPRSGARFIEDSLLHLLRDWFPELLWEDAEEEFRSPEWQDSVQQHEEEIARRLVPLVHQIPRAAIWHDGLLLARAVGAVLAGFEWASLQRVPPPGTGRSSVWERETEFGRLALGTRGNDRYTGAYAFIFDPGGDDVYELAYDERYPSRVIIDGAGHDTYRALSDAALAGGFFGTQILYDRSGNDTYRAGRLDLGAGLFGWGILIDQAGDDIYVGDTFVLGAGGFGLGLVIDSAGNDSYHAALCAEGFGFVGGVGVLYDHEGNDQYRAGGKYKDVLRYTDRYLSLAQGFAYGIRPFLSGGVGLLLDRSGNDDYLCDIFGQGSSYWWGLGGLLDRSGNDRYLAFQYAQGSAAHMTAAVLLDLEGDDYYFSKGVSQGCGHDLAAALLWDLSGSDTYTAYDLSQGAGSANGWGALFDGGGDDRYYVKSRLNAQGYGNPRRDYGSIGIFLDQGGVDRYDGAGSDSCAWRLSSQWGIGIDHPSRSGVP